MAKAYRGGLPVPNSLGQWRPIVGKQANGKPQRFQVGNKRDTSETQALARLNAIRDLYDHQCREFQVDYWVGWVFVFAKEMGRGIPIKCYGSRDAEESASRLALVAKIQSWGAPVEIADPRLMENGQTFLRDMVESLVAKEVSRIMEGVGVVWGAASQD